MALLGLPCQDVSFQIECNLWQIYIHYTTTTLISCMASLSLKSFFILKNYSQRQHGPFDQCPFRSIPNICFLLLQFSHRITQYFSACTNDQTNESSIVFPVHQVSSVPQLLSKSYGDAKCGTRLASPWTHAPVQSVKSSQLKFVPAISTNM
jgi:hypothetical protein